MLESWVCFIIFCNVQYLKHVFHIENKISPLRLTVRGKERTKERVSAGRCHGGRGCEVNVEREGETLQMGALPLWPGKHLVEGRAEAAQDNTTGLLCPLLRDLC